MKKTSFTIVILSGALLSSLTVKAQLSSLVYNHMSPGTEVKYTGHVKSGIQFEIPEDEEMEVQHWEPVPKNKESDLPLFYTGVSPHSPARYQPCTGPSRCR